MPQERFRANGSLTAVLDRLGVVWLSQTRHFRWFRPATIQYVVRSTIGLLSDSYASFLLHYIECVFTLVYEIINIFNKKLSYRRETARQLHTSFSVHSLMVHFTEHASVYSASA